MTKTRANYILQNLGKWESLKYAYRHEHMGSWGEVWPNGITEEEDAYIKMIWSLMSQESCYFDAVTKIAKGLYD